MFSHHRVYEDGDSSERALRRTGCVDSSCLRSNHNNHNLDHRQRGYLKWLAASATAVSVFEVSLTLPFDLAPRVAARA